jgi:hypothetical protein
MMAATGLALMVLGTVLILTGLGLFFAVTFVLALISYLEKRND